MGVFVSMQTVRLVFAFALPQLFIQTGSENKLQTHNELMSMLFFEMILALVLTVGMFFLYKPNPANATGNLNISFRANSERAELMEDSDAEAAGGLLQKRNFVKELKEIFMDGGYVFILSGFCLKGVIITTMTLHMTGMCGAWNIPEVC